MKRFVSRWRRLLRPALSVPIFWKVLGIGALVAALFGSVTLWQTHRMTSHILQGDLAQRTLDTTLANRGIMLDLSLLNQSILWTLLFCLIIGTGLAWGLAHILVQPIHRLDEAAQALGEGEFSAHAEVFYGDEIGRLATTFNQMTANLRKYRQEILEREKNRLSLLDKIVRAQEEERRTISRELHDQVGQSLSAVLLEFHSGCQKRANGECACTGRCLSLEERLRLMIEEVRRLAWNMRPSILDDYGLDSALARYAEEMSRQSGIPIDYQYAGPRDGHRLPGQVESTCYRIAQEAVVNIVRHSKATRASLVVVWNQDSVTLLAEDNGRGFDPAIAGQDGLHNLGLTGMRERAGLIGGSCIVESHMGKGTVVRVQIPLTEEGSPCLSTS